MKLNIINVSLIEFKKEDEVKYRKDLYDEIELKCNQLFIMRKLVRNGLNSDKDSGNQLEEKKKLMVALIRSFKEHDKEEKRPQR